MEVGWISSVGSSPSRASLRDRLRRPEQTDEVLTVHVVVLVEVDVVVTVEVR